MNKRKYKYLALVKRAKQTYKNLNKAHDEYNEEEGKHIDFHEFFTSVLGYNEDDYIKLTTYIVKRKKKQEHRKEICIKNSIKVGIGDVENPEYNKYFNIFCDYGNYLSDSSIIEKKTLINYLIRTFNYSSDEALSEARKIQAILFTKKRNNINNKLITKEINNQEIRIVGIV